MHIITINFEPVELFKILKFESIVGSGGEAKTRIGEGLVKVNGEVETRKSRKMVSGDTIEFEKRHYQLALA
ncbi:MAG: RNA-binding S4 domain-containing protein [Oceanospirillaceae bacterium]|jgi:ribosome-associated protein|nr:RNA-binding S4 domain-containing protein [Oceanospirillaceae bacterium]MBT4443403.1 RNA-binding S4 domain-containing protein [Oceanospirillaceae bacterium]MBT6078638.1 RNA-binding S4 domain-containing protein [Oceanospirillaceae bacterium]MBT7330060.1 RNA-binding S4 domain-containing protein [Oceanospirillaceae bacterium]HCH31402.1 RNA-binding protein [Oceanospirillaceae bacterium]